MPNLHRKYTKALEKSASAEKRSADAEEVIARHLKQFLSGEAAPDERQSAQPSKSAIPPKSQPPRK
jgi:hypothetical protein